MIPPAGRYGAVITQDSEAFGNCDHPRARRDGVDLVPPRIRAARARSRTGRIAMFDNFPLWPPQASAGAANVDALYVFLLVLSAFMCVAIFSLIVVFAVKYQRRPGRCGRADRRLHAARSDLVGHSHDHLFVHFCLGRFHLFQERTPPQGATEVYVVAKQWMWKVQHEEGQREINELHVPVGRDVKLVMTSQDVDPQLLRPGVPHQAGRAPRPLHDRLVPRHQTGHLSACSARSIAVPRTPA